MKNYIFILITTLSLFGKAQNISVDWSSESKAKNGMFPNKILGELNNELYIFKDKYSSEGTHHYLSLETYSSTDMQLTGSTEFKLPSIGERGDSRMLDIFLINGKLILFFDNQKNKMNRETEYKCYATFIDKNGATTGDPLVLYEEVRTGDVNSETPNCNIILSSDSSTFFLYSGNIVDGKLSAKLISSTLNLISSHSLDMPFTRSFSLSNMILDENRVFYFTSKEKTPDGKKFNYKIFAYDLKGKTSKSKELPVKTAFPITDLYMSKYKNKLRVITYYYDAVKTNATGGGTLFYEFNNTDLELKNFFESKFDATTITQLNSNSKFLKTYNSDENDNVINALINSKLIDLPNEDIIIISEQLVRLYLGTTYGQDFFNILVTRINKTGILNHPSVIPKLQSGRSKPYYSFLDVVKNNQLFLIYNDSQKNIDNEDPYEIKHGVNGLGGTVPMLVTINEKGAWSKKPLYTVDKTSAYIYPTRYYNNKAGQLIIYGQFENKVRFAIIKP